MADSHGLVRSLVAAVHPFTDHSGFDGGTIGSIEGVPDFQDSIDKASTVSSLPILCAFFLDIRNTEYAMLCHERMDGIIHIVDSPEVELLLFIPLVLLDSLDIGHDI